VTQESAVLGLSVCLSICHSVSVSATPYLARHRSSHFFSVHLPSIFLAAAASSSSSSSSRSLKHKEQMLLEVQVQQQLLTNKRLAGGKLTELGKLLAQFPIK
jgi:hypothetical protein